MKKVVSGFLLLGLLCSAAQVKPKKIAPDAVASDAASTIRVIVQWNIPIGPATAAKLKLEGGQVIAEFAALKQGVYSIPATALANLEADPNVKYVSLDRIVHKKLAYTTAAIGAAAVWAAGYSGSGVGVAILDSGINQDNNLGVKPKKTIVYSQDFTTVTTGSSPVVTAQSSGKLSKKDQNSKGQNSKDAGTTAPDWYGHGQHIAGIIASNGSESSCDQCTTSLVGVAPGSSLINLKVLNEFGEGSDSQVIAAINQAIALKDTYSIRVINLSLGRPVVESYTQDPLCQAVEAAWQAGIVVVVAAGNEGRDNSFNNQGYGTIMAPGNDPYVITVGAMKAENTLTRTDDLIASYSSKGPSAVDHIVKPDLVAPGNQVVSLMAQNGVLELTNPQNAVPLSAYQLVPTTTTPVAAQAAIPTDPTVQPPLVNFGPGYSSTYFMLNGTSMAAAVVSGAVADILEAYPNMTPDQVKILLMQTSYKKFPTSSTVVDSASGNVYVDYYDIFTVGAGYLDLQAALAGAQKVPTSGNSLSPVASFNEATGAVTLAFDSASAWTNPAVWADHRRWGLSAVWSSSELVGTNAISSQRSRWAVSTDRAEKSIWGTRSRWGLSGSSGLSVADSAESVLLKGEN